METFEKKFGQRVKEARHRAGLTQQEVAGEMFVTQNTVLNWEKGSRQPGLYTACKLAKLLNVSVGYLMTGEENEK